MESGEMIVVPDMGTAPCGAITWWRLSGVTNYLELCQAWDAAGLDASELPDPPSEQAALRRALDIYAGAHTDIVTLPKGAGFAIVDETFVQDSADEAQKPTPTYNTRFKVWIGDKGVQVTRDGMAHRKDIALAMSQSQLELTTSDIGSWLVGRANAMGAIRLRDTGGIYFIPETTRPAWTAISEALAKSTSCRVWEIPALRTKNAVAALLEALREQASGELAKIEAALDKGELGPRALKTKQAEVSEQLKLLSSYEQLLGVTQQDLRMKIEATEARVVEAVIAAEFAA